MAEKKAIQVLIVEDEPIILRYIEKKVKEIDPATIQVAAATENPLKAMQYLSELTIDLLLTDIEMADMDGLELIKRAKVKCPGLRVVILSGYSKFQYAQTALRYGVDDYLLKPLEENVFRTVFLQLRNSILGIELTEEDTDADSDENEPVAAVVIERFIKKNYRRRITINDLVEKFSYTPSYINRVFKKVYGISPIRYQVNLRIEKAKELLRAQPNADIKAIASAIGYDDPRYFSRVFHQFEGVSPSDWINKKQ